MTSPFLPIYRQFPVSDEHNLEKQLANFHVQTNTAVNQRTIGTFDTNVVPDGERWFALGNTKLRDGFRVVIPFGAIPAGATVILNHNIPFINTFTRIYGVATISTGWVPIPFSNVTAITNQIEISVNTTQVGISNGATAPNIISAVAILEFI